MTHAFEILLAALIPAAAAVIGWVQFLFARRDKRLEQTAKEEAQARLAAHERRAQATNFRPIVTIQDELAIGGGERIIGRYGGVLQPFNDEVPAEFPSGEKVYLPVLNLGGSFLEIAARSGDESHPIEFIRYVDRDSDVSGVLWYRYVPAKRGSVLRIFFHYVAPNGVIRRDEYFHKCGFRVIHRVDPELVGDSV